MNTERALYQLAKIITVDDRRPWGEPLREYPGEGVLEAVGVEDDEAAAALKAIDPDWEQLVEIIERPKLAG